MKSRVLRPMLAIASLALVVTALSGCQSIEPSGPSTGSADKVRPAASQVRPAADQPDEPPVSEALSLISSQVHTATFWSDRASSQRLGLIDLDGQAADRFDEGLNEVAADDFAAVGALAIPAQMMAENGAPFSEIDVRWSLDLVSGTPTTTPQVARVVRLADGVDLDAVAADLRRVGFAEHDVDSGWSDYTMDGMMSDHVDVLGGNVLGGHYPGTFFPEVQLQPDLHLLAIGDATGLIDPEGSALAHSLVARLGSDAADIEYAHAESGDNVQMCLGGLDSFYRHRTTLNRIRAWRSTYGIRAIGRPVGDLSYRIPGRGMVLLQAYADAGTARAAEAARTALFHGSAVLQPVVTGAAMPPSAKSPYAPGWTSSVDDNVVLTHFDYRRIRANVARGEVGGFGFRTCDPAAPPGQISPY